MFYSLSICGKSEQISSLRLNGGRLARLSDSNSTPGDTPDSNQHQFSDTGRRFLERFRARTFDPPRYPRPETKFSPQLF
jgi:hypothetical protein